MIDDISQYEEGVTIEADLCIVGAGAAGITIARELIGSGLQVCLLESGGPTLEPDTQALYNGDVVGHPMLISEGRYRVLGGSTTEWTGRCAELDDIDFAARDWVPHSGWPIGLDDLSAYYRRAEAVCGFQEAWKPNAEVPDILGVNLPALDPSRVTPFIWRYAPLGNRVYIDWGKAYREELRAAANLRVILHANVVGFETGGKNDHVDALKVRSLTRRSISVKARAFALCCGGIENARLLLASPESVPGGLGSNIDQVGRYFMQHPRGNVARLQTGRHNRAALQDMFNIFAKRSGTQYELGFALSKQAQSEHGLLNASIILTYDADQNSGWEASKRAARQLRGGQFSADFMRNLGQAFGGIDSVATNVLRRGIQGKHALLETESINLLIDLEQAPDPDSRITLAEERDALGNRKPKVDWRISEQERRTAERFSSFLGAEFKRLGLGECQPEAWLTDTAPITGDQLDRNLPPHRNHADVQQPAGRRGGCQLPGPWDGQPIRHGLFGLHDRRAGEPDLLHRGAVPASRRPPEGWPAVSCSAWSGQQGLPATGAACRFGAPVVRQSVNRFGRLEHEGGERAHPGQPWPGCVRWSRGIFGNPGLQPAGTPDGCQSPGIFACR
ncbi:FAD-dependent oxidoreductase [Dankookia sp. P2]|uniref:FAD-dependent oxidoreductase n=1 Tax=Dankookia sp. P2 TaxID=3423955 RepID=UPI003D666E46